MRLVNGGRVGGYCKMRGIEVIFVPCFFRISSRREYHVFFNHSHVIVRHVSTRRLNGILFTTVKSSSDGPDEIPSLSFIVPFFFAQPDHPEHKPRRPGLESPRRHRLPRLRRPPPPPGANPFNPFAPATSTAQLRRRARRLRSPAVSSAVPPPPPASLPKLPLVPEGTGNPQSPNPSYPKSLTSYLQ